MKTAISVPEETFDRATRRAEELGISRSALFTEAAQRYLDELDSASITEQVDRALGYLESPEESAADAVSEGHRVLGAIDDQW